MPKKTKEFQKHCSKTRKLRSKNDWKILLEYNKNSKKALREMVSLVLYQMLLHQFPELLMLGIC
jgi:hypothetical protein